MKEVLYFLGGSGRSGWGEKSKPIIGSVILHDKLKYWTSGDNSIHYHQGTVIFKFHLFLCTKCTTKTLFLKL